MSDQSIEERRLQLDRERLAHEERELELQREEGKKGKDPSRKLGLEVLIALLAFASGSLIQPLMNRDLERQKLESSLILKAIETGNQQDAARNLLFFRDLGLIEDPRGQIAKLRNKPSAAPVLPQENNPVRRSKAVSMAVKGDVKSIQVSIDGNSLNLTGGIANFDLEESTEHSMTWVATGTPGTTYSIDVMIREKRFFEAKGKINDQGSDFGSSQFILPSSN